MNRAITVLAPAAIALLAVTAPAGAQSEVYEPQYNLAYDRLAVESERIAAVQTELQSVTDVVRGCELLNESMTHLQEADRLLGELINYAERLRWRDQRESAEERREVVQEEIALKQGDIDTFCTAAP